MNNRAIQQINAATRATIAATNAENAREQAMISGLQNDSFNDVINGVQATVDTMPGQRYITPLGQAGRQWINGNNVVVESGLSPGAAFIPLTRQADRSVALARKLFPKGGFNRAWALTYLYLYG